MLSIHSFQSIQNLSPTKIQATQKVKAATGALVHSYTRHNAGDSCDHDPVGNT